MYRGLFFACVCFILTQHYAVVSGYCKAPTEEEKKTSTGLRAFVEAVNQLQNDAGIGQNIAKAVKEAGTALSVASVMWDAKSVADAVCEDRENGEGIEKSAETVGGVAGRWLGAGYGAAWGASIGSVVPVVGTAAGGLIGGIAGGLTASMVGEKAGHVAADAYGKLAEKKADRDLIKKIN